MGRPQPGRMYNTHEEALHPSYDRTQTIWQVYYLWLNISYTQPSRSKRTNEFQINCFKREAWRELAVINYGYFRRGGVQRLHSWIWTRSFRNRRLPVHHLRHPWWHKIYLKHDSISINSWYLHLGCICQRLRIRAYFWVYEEKLNQGANFPHKILRNQQVSDIGEQDEHMRLATGEVRPHQKQDDAVFESDRFQAIKLILGPSFWQQRWVHRQRELWMALRAVRLVPRLVLFIGFRFHTQS